ncbi:radical SAM/SPASM domain-containing protein [Dendrosporobacter sp. 1207_IL3150]|uniref:radical SAM/SPASM domain-containing protein n=1 Tax=Dendrosporobacter sp. 1207_IL3150 TaxID=3084054 RepID=UPI002FDB5816
MFYRLNEHCQLVTGAKRGAIYDFNSGKVFSINGGAVELLKACRDNKIESILDTACPENQVYLQFLDGLTAKGLGGFYAIKTDNQLRADQSPPSPKLEFLWLELTSGCNNKCLHCYATSGPTVQETDKVPHDRWLSVISEARQQGATAIQLIGGEPLMYKKWRELVVKADEEGYELIEIFTNATLIDDSCIDFFKQHKVNIATTIYADNAEVHDKVTLNKGSFEKTLRSVKKIIDAGLQLRIASIIMKANEDQPENIMKLCSELGVEPTPPDVVRPTGRGDDKDLLPSSYTKAPIKPPFYTDEQSFQLANSCHTCLNGKIAITANGDVIPCIFARNKVCGNVLTTPLSEIINGQALKDVWNTTKDQVDKCKDCEYRYACNDCRPLAQGSDNKKRWLACSAGCLYNPYTGKWSDDNTQDK